MSEVFRTRDGSTVTVTGAHRGTVEIVFDWFEEGACQEAQGSVTADVQDTNDAWLHWRCDCCGERQARLFLCVEPTMLDWPEWRP